MSLLDEAPDNECEECGGTGVVFEFRRWAGEAVAGEPVEMTCPSCGGDGYFED